MKTLLAGIALSALSLEAATAADLGSMPVKSTPVARVFDWTGLYVGGQVGYGGGSLGAGTNAVPLQAVFFPHSTTGMTGGFQVGGNLQLPNRIVLGAEADISFVAPIDHTKLTPAPFNTTLDHIGTVRGRVGYAYGTWLPYLTAGLAWGRTVVSINDANGDGVDRRAHQQYGWTAGAGIEVALSGNWSGKVEYSYIDLGAKTYSFDGIPATRVDPKLQMVKVGLNYRLWDGPLWAPTRTAGALPDNDNWTIHGQTTGIMQGYPAFRSPYQGSNSLPGGGLGRDTWTADAFLGWRLWDGGELYFNPELAQGFGIGSTLGIAGFSNGEAQKGGAEYPKFRPQRYFFRQTFGLGGEQEDVSDGPMQLAGKRDIDRITVTVGRFAVGDYFDGNSYAKDPRADFMNWAMWASAAYDFPADLPGFTRGAVVELNRKDWALRAGVFQVPAAPNSDSLTFNGAGTVAEFEERHTIFGQPGKLRLGVFANRGTTGNYNQAMAITAADPTIAINDAMLSIRQERWKYGFYINGEQQVATDIGVFARLSWNDGQNEILSFTDIDQSLSGGVSIKGSYWGRSADTVGIGGAINGLSRAHRDFLAAGGNGLLIGDGALNYRPEQIVEAYYAYALNKSVTLTADYQLVVNPAYNADRGPASIFSGRVHAEF
ncbi:carbohydrate porin [Bradyrhizobium sp. U87765 SZCCT0131]|uniref:carbohydrate porin n=1 Tax=unclassified Bradyrhizobium TaxID=2631580 RepID=UPI001BA4934C|nr:MULTISPECIES: carbohydrate porin [unclassified Bradyrhizobium]MBR1217201.1 carbohydrate porin [Bradyrhizobium sp. U87765 SZCCT0131]MBR1259043.1 carbohydrate porin [Bradyrhizobium sp. U87765 SZCCT0134]MBR1305184.1 carbohydrate porin [Bradyrhizobium sp. U87765 SZCCT0110]MBR1320970.1 carbohydrate porin [Bradyrhizobium sp. U87765 SZCCT0109]MBR1350376.1 carbohydrate porin [Bradyrhizobium sp. U87765 SZCCT0048]